MDEVMLTPEQQAEAERIEDIVRAGAAAEICAVARLLASKDNRHLWGATEFQIRDAVHCIGARALDAALSERKTGVPRIQRELSPLPRRREVHRLSHVPEGLSEGRFPRLANRLGHARSRVQNGGLPASPEIRHPRAGENPAPPHCANSAPSTKANTNSGKTMGTEPWPRNIYFSDAHTCSSACNPRPSVRSPDGCPTEPTGLNGVTPSIAG